VSGRGEPELLAGGTDLHERLRSGVSRGPVVAIGARAELRTIERSPSGTSLGALVTLAEIGRDERLAAEYPALVLPAQTLATPEIREMATLGGSLLQRTRCWYFRQPSFSCLKKGGEGCPARAGNHRFGVVFDRGACVHPHPSSMGAALLAYDAEVETDRRFSVARLFDGARDHALAPGELLAKVHLPRPVAGERAAYFRMMSRAHAEWPLVEVVVRLVADDAIRLARVAVGGVADAPLRLPHVESALEGRPPTLATFEHAASLAIEGARALPMTEYKIPLLRASVLEALERA
jgi:xanthine dehydrogenase YagS FAD-binding subunit